MQRIVAGVIALTLSVVGAAAQSSAPGDKAEALWEAARKGDVAAVAKLLNEGVDVNTKMRYGATALSYACDRGNLEVVKLLIERGADVNVRDTFYGATPLIWAVNPATGRKPQHPEIVRLLLQRGAQGKGPALMAAVSASDVVTTKVILESGGFEAGPLSDALEAAKRGGNADIVATLEKAGAKPRVEFRIDEAQLARYAGTYRGPGDTEMVVAVSGGRLTANPGRPLTLVARDATTFGVVEAPGATLTFHVEGDKATSVAFPNDATRWTRVEGK